LYGASFGAGGQKGTVELFAPVRGSVLLTVRSEVDNQIGNYKLKLSSTRSANMISPEQRSALNALFTSTGGPGWTNNTGWMGPRGTECFWYGVVCQDGKVVALNLANNNLTGTMPDV